MEVDAVPHVPTARAPSSKAAARGSGNDPQKPTYSCGVSAGNDA
jgi:hypothetical protein